MKCIFAGLHTSHCCIIQCIVPYIIIWLVVYNYIDNALLKCILLQREKVGYTFQSPDLRNCRIFTTETNSKHSRHKSSAGCCSCMCGSMTFRDVGTSTRACTCENCSADDARNISSMFTYTIGLYGSTSRILHYHRHRARCHSRLLYFIPSRKYTYGVGIRYGV